VVAEEHKLIVLHCQDLLTREQEQVFTAQLAPMVGNELHEQYSAVQESQDVPGVHGAGVMVLELDVVVSDVGVPGGVKVSILELDVVVSDVGVTSGVRVLEFDVVVSDVGVMSGVGSDVVGMGVVALSVTILGVVTLDVGLTVLETLLEGCDVDSFV
jgi:hypothetical protein